MYYIDEDFFPVQILLNTSLSIEQYLYLKSSQRVVNDIIIDRSWDKRFFKKCKELSIKKGKIETVKKLLLKAFEIE